MTSEIKLTFALTDDKDLDLAFPAEFIPAEVKVALPEDLHVRRWRHFVALEPKV